MLSMLPKEGFCGETYSTGIVGKSMNRNWRELCEDKRCFHSIFGKYKLPLFARLRIFHYKYFFSKLTTTMGKMALDGLFHGCDCGKRHNNKLGKEDLVTENLWNIHTHHKLSEVSGSGGNDSKDNCFNPLFEDFVFLLMRVSFEIRCESFCSPMSSSLPHLSLSLANESFSMNFS